MCIKMGGGKIIVVYLHDIIEHVCCKSTVYFLP